MFAWYKAAQLCIVHLADVTDREDAESFGNSVWFTRGWTLQELLAPAALTFYTSDWAVIGSKDSHQLALIISKVTGIPQRMLKSPDILHNVSVARRMSWVAGRQTSRTEDLAYCLLGIFDINMPLLYGEGQKAFYRLQMEIMDQLDDESLFAWQDDPSTAESATHGLLAKSPSKFAACGNIVCTQTPSRLQSPPIRMTSRGAEVFSELSETYSSTAEGQPIFVYELGCGTTHSNAYCLDMQVGGHVLREGKVRPCSIALSRNIEGASFTRIDAGSPISNLSSKYIHASYVRPARFYIRTSWSGEVTFSRIYTGKRPKHRSHSPDKVTRLADQFLNSISQSTPYRSFSTRAKLTTRDKLTALQEEASILVNSASKSRFERKSSDQSDADIITIKPVETENSLEWENALPSSLGTPGLIPTIEEGIENFDFVVPEFLQAEVEAVSRSRSRRNRKWSAAVSHSPARDRAPYPPAKEKRSLSFSNDDVEAGVEQLGMMDFSMSDEHLDVGDVLSRDNGIEADETGSSPINRDPEANESPIEHGIEIKELAGPISVEISGPHERPEEPGQLHKLGKGFGKAWSRRPKQRIHSKSDPGVEAAPLAENPVGGLSMLAKIAPEADANA